MWRAAWVALAGMFVCACVGARRETPPPGPACAVQRLGGPGSDEIDAMARAPDGSIIVAGAFEGAVRFGAHAVRSDGGQDAFASKMTRTGRTLWVARIGSDARDIAWAVTVGHGQDAFVIGLHADRHCFVARLAGADGREMWRTRFAGQGTHLCRAIDVGPTGEIVVFGSTQGELVFDSAGAAARQSSGRSMGGNDLLVARLSPADGSVLATHVLGGGGNDLGRAVVIRRDGDVYLGGQFSGEVAPGDGALDVSGRVITSHGDFDALIARLRPDGHVAWARGFGGPGFDLVKALALDRSGGVLAVGPLQRPADYGDEPPFFTGGFDGYLTHHAASGALLWSKRFVGDEVQAHQIQVDDARRVWLGGHLRGSADLGSRTLRAAGGMDAWGAVFAPDGTLLWAAAFGGEGDEHGYALAIDSTDLVMGGTFSAQTTLCGRTIESRGAMDAYVLRVRPTL